MCDMLQNNVTLLKIDLSDNGFSDSDTSYLLDALKVGNTKDFKLICSGSSVPLNTEPHNKRNLGLAKPPVISIRH